MDRNETLSAPGAAARSFIVAERETLAAVAGWGGSIVVDFDETLYLRNSTEDFIGGAMPGYAAAVALKFLDLIAPWRWMPGPATRDVWRLRLVMLLLPWTTARWRRGCAGRAASFTNVPLLGALRARGQDFIIASNGFTPVITPLLRAMGCGEVRLIANVLGAMQDKRAMIEAVIGRAGLAGAMVITDSVADGDVLEACARPCLTRWAGAEFIRAFSNIYLPGDYLARVKRPAESGVLRRLVAEDIFSWVLIAAPAPSPWFIIGICLLFGSFWSVYEAGYRENDVCAVKFEADPVVSLEFADFAMPRFEAKCWMSAVVLGLAGVLASRVSDFFMAVVAWAALLLGLRAIYYVYNRLDKQSRVWLYLLLQGFRSLAPVAVVAIGPVGMAAGAAQALARWQGYFLYRQLRDYGVLTWPQAPVRLMQLVVFLLLLGVLSASGDGPDVWSWRAGLIGCWCAVLARKEIWAAGRGVHRLDRGT